jgi:hypothetical protein
LGYHDENTTIEGCHFNGGNDNKPWDFGVKFRNIFGEANVIPVGIMGI